MSGERSALRNRLEYLGVRVLLGGLRRLPPRAAFAIADRLGDLAYRIDGKHRKVALSSLERVFGATLDEAQRVALGKRIFRSFLRVAVELALLPDLIARRGIEGVVEVVG